MIPIQILGTATYLPPTVVPSEDIDHLLGTAPGWAESKSGVRQRYFAESMPASEMGAKAVQKALERVSLTLDSIDCLICASGSAEQPIPCTAALILRTLTPESGSIAAFDVNSTCLSFITALDLAAALLAVGRYQTIAIVSSEISSRGLNWHDRESAMLFGDGAAAAIVAKAPAGSSSALLGAAMQTYSRGVYLTEIRGGGSKLPAFMFARDNRAEFLFSMDGRTLFRMASELLPPFVDRLLTTAGVDKPELQCVIPHQASLPSMKLLQKRLGFTDQQFFINIQEFGNTIAASIPIALDQAIRTGKIERGKLVLLVGTSAGFSVGGILLRY